MSSASSPQPPQLHSIRSFESEGRRLIYYGAGVGLAVRNRTSCDLVQTEDATFADGYMPHFYCYLGSRGLVWSHVLTDSLIDTDPSSHLHHPRAPRLPRSARNAFSLDVSGFRIIYRRLWTHALYGGCHGLGSDVCLSAIIKGFTAMASVATAVALPFIVPQILLMVHKAKESDQYLRFLESGLSEREAAQGELRRINELLEARVQERTLELDKANQELRASEKQYRLLFEGNPMPMWVVDRDNCPPGFLRSIKRPSGTTATLATNSSL